VLKTYGAAPYGAELRKLEKEIKDKQQTINEKIGVKVATPAAPLLQCGLTFRRNQTPD
jgi:26S proteasome regulatory subunit T1